MRRDSSESVLQQGTGVDPGRLALDAARLSALTLARSCAVELEPKQKTSVGPSSVCPLGDDILSRASTLASRKQLPSRLHNPNPGAGYARPKSEEARGRIRPTQRSERMGMVLHPTRRLPRLSKTVFKTPADLRTFYPF